MTVSFSRAGVDEFRAAIAGRLGLQFDDGKLDFIAEVLGQRLTLHGGTTEAYLKALASDSREEWRALASCLTVGETYFLRNPDQYRALAEAVLPDRIAARARERRLRLLSAGCASGDEAYSIAIALRDGFPELAGWDLKIIGVDVNPATIEKARRARYSAWALRETPSEIRERHFRMDGKDFVLTEAIRAMVNFEERNLIEEDPVFWLSDEFDAVLCRNVIMYLTPELMRLIISRLTQTLAPGGYLFLGHAETLRGLSHEFHLRHTHGAFYYQKRPAAALGMAAVPDGARAVPAARPVPSSDTCWMDVVRAASERIEKLARQCGAPVDPGEAVRTAAASAALAKPPVQPLALSRAMELLQEERFSDALETLGRLSPDLRESTEARLLRAVLLANCGKLDEAQSVCEQVLASDEFNAGAHYLMALCREHAGDRASAAEHNRAAAYLDPGFAMPHLHLGLLAQKHGDLAAAAGELRQAEMLLLREDSSRILLFGGGFSREALLAFARTQLRRTGGTL